MILEPSADEVVKPTEVTAVTEGEAVHAGTGTPPKLSRKERAILRATADLQRENEELRRQVEAGKTPVKQEPTKEAVAAKPRRADFADDEAYDGALLAWGDNQRRVQAILQNYAAQVREAKENYPDWDAVVNQDVHIGQSAQLAILELENAADVVYFLGKNPSYAAKLGQMSYHAAAAEIGRLSERLNGAPSGDEYRRPRPQVPAPVRTVSTAGSSAAPSFSDIAARPNYPGKAKDLKRALAER